MSSQSPIKRSLMIPCPSKKRRSIISNQSKKSLSKSLKALEASWNDLKSFVAYSGHKKTQSLYQTANRTLQDRTNKYYTKTQAITNCEGFFSPPNKNQKHPSNYQYNEKNNHTPKNTVAKVKKITLFPHCQNRSCTNIEMKQKQNIIQSQVSTLIPQKKQRFSFQIGSNQCPPPQYRQINPGKNLTIELSHQLRKLGPHLQMVRVQTCKNNFNSNSWTKQDNLFRQKLNQETQHNYRLSSKSNSKQKSNKKLPQKVVKAKVCSKLHLLSRSKQPLSQKQFQSIQSIDKKKRESFGIKKARDNYLDDTILMPVVNEPRSSLKYVRQLGRQSSEVCSRKQPERTFEKLEKDLERISKWPPSCHKKKRVKSRLEIEDIIAMQIESKKSIKVNI